jgi:hypothetical protein
VSRRIAIGSISRAPIHQRRDNVRWSYALLQIPVGTPLDRIGITWLMRMDESEGVDVR